ncbi:MAG: UDP-N-acetylmuramoyl-tripeptide--D-alanyl-D-alanine ligase [Alphaproteobacteria bacterium]|nr:UDP-N-acetylmuramoyl-tripeptide--D-alanyl-D-alanine ligase [Rickettsiales bacterium]
MANISCRLYLKDLIQGAGSTVISHNIQENTISYGAVFDSRMIGQNFVFFAIKGEKNDGHEYVINAIKNGANCVVISELTDDLLSVIKKSDKKIYYIQTTNTLLALQQMAKYHCNTVLKAKVVAVTGSVGKTSITRCVGLVLSKFKNTHFPQRNFNNHIGLPITILNASNDVKIMVLEMGMNHEGEISVLADIAKPDVVIVSNIHPVHIGNFEGKINKIVKAKAEVFSFVKTGGVVILNQTNEHFAELKKIALSVGIKNILSVGKTVSHLYLSKHKLGQFYTMDYEISIKGTQGLSLQSGIVNSIAEHDMFNLLFIYAVAKLFNFDLNTVSNIITKIPVLEGRGNLQTIFVDGKKITLINSSYNASLPSIKEGTITLCKLKELQKSPRAIYIIGDILELGDEMGAELHKELGKFINQHLIDGVITVGDLTKNMHEEFDEGKLIQHFKHAMSLSKKIRSLVQDGDVLLFKASNGINLSMVVDKLCR